MKCYKKEKNGEKVWSKDLAKFEGYKSKYDFLIEQRKILRPVPSSVEYLSSWKDMLLKF